MSDSNDVPPADFDIARPQAANLVESLRAFGYDVPSAVADLVDNSITAGARNIWIDFHWNGADSEISITDDGNGMTETQLVTAMHLGCISPLAERAPHDLGRFGLGLKTASFSQCRRLLVCSKSTGQNVAARCWDLDHVARVNEWQLLRAIPVGASARLTRLNVLPQGTTILWQAMDRLVAGQVTPNERQQQRFLEHAEAVRKHLSIVFHLFMSESSRLKIFLNDRQVVPWDPFLADEIATQVLPKTRLRFKDASVDVAPFVLPHHSKIGKEKYETAAGPRGWNAHQGFYIYRHGRLLVPGGWLGFGWPKEEQFKLARIRVDIPNSLDHDWDVDVTKSRASAPAGLRDELRRIAERTRNDAKRVFYYRGALLKPQADETRILLWEPLAKHDRVFYRLNRDHPLLARILTKTADRSSINALLRMIEETVPLPHITAENNERPDRLPGPFEQTAESQVRDVMMEAFRSLTESGYGNAEAADRLRTIWPFELFPAILESLGGTNHHG